MDPQQFASTQWSIVVSAGRGNDSPSSRQALAELCRRYWYPLYAFARRSGTPSDSAPDAVQEFFSRMLEKNMVASADPTRGRFRNFLLASFRNFLSHQAERDAAQKRGGGRIDSLDVSTGEDRWIREPTDHADPAKLFERAWVTTLLERVWTRLKTEYVESGRTSQFDLFQSSLYGPREGGSYAESAAELGITEEAARQAARRLRTRYRELLYEEVTATVDGPDEVEDEIRTLFSAIS